MISGIKKPYSLDGDGHYTCYTPPAMKCYGDICVTLSLVDATLRWRKQNIFSLTPLQHVHEFIFRLPSDICFPGSPSILQIFPENPILPYLIWGRGFPSAYFIFVTNHYPNFLFLVPFSHISGPQVK